MSAALCAGLLIPHILRPKVSGTHGDPRSGLGGVVRPAPSANETVGSALRGVPCTQHQVLLP